MNFVVMRRVLVHESDYQVVEFFARLFLISEHVVILEAQRSNRVHPLVQKQCVEHTQRSWEYSHLKGDKESPDNTFYD